LLALSKQLTVHENGLSASSGKRQGRSRQPQTARFRDVAFEHATSGVWLRSSSRETHKHAAKQHSPWQAEQPQPNATGALHFSETDNILNTAAAAMIRI
jgi:hypothetical protein